MFVNVPRVKWYVTVPHWSNKSIKGGCCGKQGCPVDTVGCSCLENELEVCVG